MTDYKIHIPARRKPFTECRSPVVRVSRDAYNALVDIYNESTLSMAEVASRIIMQSLDRIVYDKED